MSLQKKTKAELIALLREKDQQLIAERGQHASEMENENEAVNAFVASLREQHRATYLGLKWAGVAAFLIGTAIGLCSATLVGLF